jgi:hypothetical protein
MDSTQDEPHNCPSIPHRIFLCIYIVPVTLLNLILLCFIKYRTVCSMKEYKMVLYTTTIIDFTSAWMQFLIGIVSCQHIVKFKVLIVLETITGK